MEWIAKKVTAAALNTSLGWLIEDLSDSNVNQALLSGELDLKGVTIRRDALSFLDAYYGQTLPVEVIKGRVGRLQLRVPYSNFLTQPLVVNIEDVMLVVGPVHGDGDRQRELEVERASKRSKLAALFPESAQQQQSAGFLSANVLFNHLFNNLELHINGIHIRYEDPTNASHPLAIGLTLKTISIYNTNGKWKKISPDGSSGTIHKVVDMNGLSVYINPKSDPQRMVKPHITTDMWWEYMKLGLNSYTINSEPFKFLLEPVRCKVKIRQQHHESGRESRVPGLLIDAVVKEAATIVITKDQLIAVREIADAFETINRNRLHRDFRPKVPLKRHATDWWHYAIESVLHNRVRPYSWEYIKKYRDTYKKYLSLYKRYLTESRNSELQADLRSLEDRLSVHNITIARCQAKIDVSRECPELVVSSSEKHSGWLSAISWLWQGVRTGGREIAGRHSRHGMMSCLTEEERSLLEESLKKLQHGYSTTAKSDKEIIDQKIYITLQNSCISLRDNLHEVAVATITGFGTSFESRQAINYHKFSVKIDSLMMEGCSMENDLVSVMKLVEETHNRGYGFAFSCDYEVNPMSSKADYGLSMRLHPVELTYNQNAVTELIQFFQLPVSSQSDLNEIAKVALKEVITVSKANMSYILTRRKTYHLDIDIKSPYIILPEHGSLQSGGNVLIIDIGGLQITTECGDIWSGTENATRMELEEKLYDRYSISIAQLQVLFSDSGDEWRAMRSKDDSDLHLLPRLRINMSVANSIFPKYREKPQQKMDFHITPIKFNVSENRLTHLVEFVHNFPVPNTCSSDEVDGYFGPLDHFDQKHYLIESNMSSLFEIKHSLNLNFGSPGTSGRTSKRGGISPILSQLKQDPSVDISQTSLELLEYFPNSENSDDDVDACLDIIKATIDLPGFDDNVSPHNMIKVITRFCIDELVFGMSRSSDQGDRSYLMLKLTHIVVETASMDYGPAFQLTLKSIHLVDKFHPSPNGEYLEMVSSPPDGSVVTVLYRKVDPKCPEFASHFHNTEQSLIFNVSCVNLVWHKGAVITLINFYNILSSKFTFIRESVPKLKAKRNLLSYIPKASESSPIPSGATKWSFSTHMNSVNIKLCESDMDVMEIKLAGLEMKSLFKANDRKIFQASLTDIIVDDLSEITLHNRIIEVEEDLVFNIKYDELSPGQTEDYGEGSKKSSGTKPQAYFDVRVGRIQIVFLWKLIADLQRFVEPVISRERTHVIAKASEELAENTINEKLLQKRVVYRIDIQTPTVLIPQKSDSPSLLVLNMGSLKIENMFSNTTVENILVELSSFHISRAVMTLGGGLEMQEPILEPAKIRCDIKRSRYTQNKEYSQWDIDTHFGVIRVNLGQRDLNTIIAVTTQNSAEAQFSDGVDQPHQITPAGSITLEEHEDENVGKLEAFLTSSDAYKLATISFGLDGATLTFYTDMDEVLSSPVRDAATALARVDMGELQIRGDMTSGRDLELRMTLDYCDIFDVRPDSDNVIKKLFGQYIVNEQIRCGGVYVSSPHMLCATYNSNQNCDSSLEITLEKTRFNVSANFFLSLYKYISEAIPSGKDANGLMNPGFIEDTNAYVDGQNIGRPPSSSDSTSGYLSTATNRSEDNRVTTIALQIKSPEIVLFAEPEKIDSQVLVVNFETTLDYSKHPSYEDWKLHVQDISVYAASYTERKQIPYPVLEPCTLISTLKICPHEEQERADIELTRFCFHVNPAVVNIIRNVSYEITKMFIQTDTITLTLPAADMEDLWLPKKLSANVFPSYGKDEMSVKPRFSNQKSQMLCLRIEHVEISLEDQSEVSAVPVIQILGSICTEVKDWKGQMSSKHEISMCMNYFNAEDSKWEPVLEQIPEKNCSSRYVDLIIQTLFTPSTGIGISKRQPQMSIDKVDTTASPSFRRSSLATSTIQQFSGSSSESEDDCDSEMLILKAQKNYKKYKTSTKRSNLDVSNYQGYQQDSDSETEDGVVHKISSAFSRVFFSDSEDAGSDDDNRSSADQETDGDFIEAVEPNATPSATKKRVAELNAELLKESENSRTDLNKEVEETELMPDEVDSGVASDDGGEQAMTVLVSATDQLEFTLTPRLLKSCLTLTNKYTSVSFKKPLPLACLPDAPECLPPRTVVVTNEVGPDAVVTVYASGQGEDGRPLEDEMLVKAQYREAPDSTPSSPASVDRSRENLLEADEEDQSIDWDQLNLNLEPPKWCVKPKPTKQSYNAMDSICMDPVKLFKAITSYKINIYHPGFEPLMVYVGTKASNRVFQLCPTTSTCRYYIVVSVKMSYTAISVDVGSPLKVCNDTNMPITLCFKKTMLEQLPEDMQQLVGVASPSNPFDSHLPLVTLLPDETYSVPLVVAYHSPLYIQPAATDFRVSEDGACWRDLRVCTRPFTLTCIKAQLQPHHLISFAVTMKEGAPLDNYQSEEGLLSVVPNYVVYLKAPATVYNHLPYTLNLQHKSLSQSSNLDPGACTQIYKIDPKERLMFNLQVLNYQGHDWQATLELPVEKTDDTRAVTFTCPDMRHKMELAVRTVRCPALMFIVHAPYWIVNKTGFTFSVRGSRHKTEYESNSQEEILLFRYKRNYPRKVKVRVAETDWSPSFSMDSVATNGLVVCRDNKRNKKFRLICSTELAALQARVPIAEGPMYRGSNSLHLTKLVTFMPYFLVRNWTHRPLRFMEENDKMDLWNDLEPKECKSFWPEGDELHMVVQLRDSKSYSQRFHFNSLHSTVLRMERGRALVVRVGRASPSEPMVISFERYTVGDVPVRIENWCDDVVLKFRQQDSNQVTLIQQRHYLLYTWDDPSLPHQLLWSVYDRKREEFSANIKKDGQGSTSVMIQSTTRSLSQSCAVQPKTRPPGSKKRRTKTVASSSEDDEEKDEDYSLLNDATLNRVGTHNERVTIYWVSYKDDDQRVLLFTQSERLMNLTQAPKEKATTELCVSLHRLGISFVSNREEICYTSLQSSPALWELYFNGRWKSLPSLELSSWLEDQYLNNPENKVDLQGTLQKPVANEKRIKVDLDKMMMYKPIVVKLRRVKQPAVWLHYRHSKHYTSLMLNVETLQIDNQLYDAQFPTVLSAAGNNNQPCLSCTVMVGKTPRHLSLIGKEMTLKLDDAFCRRMQEFITSVLGSGSGSIVGTNMHGQLKNMLTPITFQCSQPQCNSCHAGASIERVCLAGMSVNFSYSPAVCSATSPHNTDAISNLLISLGASLTEVKNVKLSLGQYEREDIPWSTLVHDFSNHAKTQIFQQLYVLVLGLDILGNPYQRVRDLTQGVREALYDPEQGLLEHPDGYSSRAADRARQLLSLVVGGAADSAANITGVIANTLATLTLDRTYQMKRRQLLNTRQDKSLPLQFLEVNQSFLTGVLLALSGVIHKPITGAQEDGIEGFFRGVGRGVLGLITKPALGVLDVINFAFDSLRRAAHMGLQVDARARLPRHVCRFTGLQLYNSHTAQGRALLATLKGGQYLHTDTYYAHALLSGGDRPPVALVTDKNIFLVERYGMWSTGEVSWKVPLSSIARHPSLEGDGKRLVLELRSSDLSTQLTGAVRTLESEDKTAMTYLTRAIESLMTAEMVNQPCPRV